MIATTERPELGLIREAIHPITASTHDSGAVEPLKRTSTWAAGELPDIYPEAL